MVADNNNSRAVVEGYAHRIWHKKDLKALDDLLHENVVIHSALGDYYGKDSMRAVVKAWLHAFPNLLVENHQFICENDLVAIQWHAMGKHQGDFKGIKPTGNAVSYKGSTVYRVQDNKIIEYWAYLDMQHVMNQLG